MRKSILPGIVLVLAAALALPAAPAARAQDGGELQFGQPVQGTISDSEYEHSYTFQGTAGTLVQIEMNAGPEAYELDPALLLRDPSGDVVAQNDDFSVSFTINALLVTELTEDGLYTVVATRSGGSTGYGGGDYTLTVREAPLLAPGSTAEATITYNFEYVPPSLFFLKPEAASTWAIGFEQPGGDLYAALTLTAMTDEYGTTVFDLVNTAKIRSGTLNVDLDAGVLYILAIQQSSSSYPSEEMEITVTVSVNEAGGGITDALSQ